MHEDNAVFLSRFIDEFDRFFKVDIYFVVRRIYCWNGEVFKALQSAKSGHLVLEFPSHC